MRPYCRKISSVEVTNPSARATLLVSSTVASVEPSATVTTKSKAFILVKVRLPDTRSSSSSPA